MFRENDFEVPVKVENERARQMRELAAAVRRGCVIAPKHWTGQFFGTEGSACALGAAWLGMGRSRWELGNYYSPVRRLFPALGDDDIWRVALKNDHGWRRKEIADWLDAEAAKL